MGIKAGPDLAVTLNVIDYGSIRIQRSVDNPDCVRIHMHDVIGDHEATMDLTNDELIGLINGLSMYVED